MQPEGLRQMGIPMPQSLARILIHLVFSTKNREPLIAPQFRDRTFAYLAGTLNAIDCPTIIVGGMTDHVHLLFAMARTLSMSKVVEEVKKESSKWAKEHGQTNFYWQNGYGAFSVSPSNVDAVRTYIETRSASPSPDVSGRISSVAASSRTDLG